MRAKRSEAWQSRFKKINFKNLVSLINEFYKKWIASFVSLTRNDSFFAPSLRGDSRSNPHKIYCFANACVSYATYGDDEEEKNYFEIISRFFMTFYIIVVDFTDYIITNYLLKNSLLKVFSLNSYFKNFYLNYSKEFSFNYLNSFLNFGVMNNFVKLNDFGNCYKWKDFLFNTKNQKKF